LQDLHGNVPGNARLVPARVLQLEILLLGTHITKGVGQTAAPLATGTLIHAQAIGKDFGTGIGWKNILKQGFQIKQVLKYVRKILTAARLPQVALLQVELVIVIQIDIVQHGNGCQGLAARVTELAVDVGVLVDVAIRVHRLDVQGRAQRGHVAHQWA